MAQFRVGLTGGIASGKSAADAAFAGLGVVIADADVIARELVEPGQAALAEVVAHFGTDVLGDDGRLDRASLRGRIFAHPADKTALESILHPRIRAELEARTAAAPGDIAIASIPLLTEGGGRDAYPWLDRILVIDVAPETQRARLMARDGIDAELAQQMIAAQASREDRLAIADDVVCNEDTLDTLRSRIAELCRFYQRLAAEAAG
ncbi:dephospho-CoA kinase [Solilutibacter tolerans]|uniref:Dephospho-CoA kinase n=1 Tax=Solilutibacter tolerans TaxID=1604334 RepID=A0A1N6NDT4_9GAMM|nr:dephospho-CoA kinase [Lysobacter tolerans]SIP90222.1 dephospho-CoA kinase [Lysobacter tolerans]